MTKTILKTTSEFTKDVTVNIPTGGTSSVQVKFTAHFKSQPNTQEHREALEEQMEELGVRAFLDLVMPRTTFGDDITNKFGFADDEGNEISPDEWVRQNAFASNAVSAAFWREVNKDLEGKRSARSRRR